ncbi:hypothetical protein GQ44DRAFT_734030 [Phaeosphaeriaceae sp. PMI808]|nr:hypothetical protein GQ44DRAFT_734030 [Phaeosphaeriaceae sp. PMI808]
MNNPFQQAEFPLTDAGVCKAEQFLSDDSDPRPCILALKDIKDEDPITIGVNLAHIQLKPEFWTLLKLQDFMSQAVHLKELTVAHSRPLMDDEEEMLYRLRGRGVNVDIRSDEIIY